MPLDSPTATETLRIAPHPTLKGHSLIEAAQWFPLPVDKVFSFFSDPFNLEEITPPWLHFQVLHDPPLAIVQGLELNYRLRLHGLPLKWRSRISVWEPIQAFVDEQLIGPYRTWYHEHRFEPSQNGTLVLDRVTYAVPGGERINRWFVQPDLLKIFSYRQTALARILSEKADSVSASLR